MKISKFELVDRCLFWEEKKILIVGDLHLGYEDYLNESGVALVKTQMEETFELFEKIFSVTGKVKKIILLGDVKHHFGGILHREFNDFYKLIDVFKKNLYKGGKVVIVKGNHDNILEPIVLQKEFSGLVELKDFYKEGDVLFFHGDKYGFDKIKLGAFDKNVKVLVCGHFHPAVYIREDVKTEKYKCFLLGKNKEFKKEVVVVPSFFPLVEGADVSVPRERDFSNFDVYALSGKFNEVLKFGKVKDLK